MTATSLPGGSPTDLSGRDDAAWSPGPADPPFPAGEVHLWRVGLHPPRSPAPLSIAVQQLLSCDERARLDGLCDAQRRESFVRTRAALRVLLGRYLGLPAAGIRFEYGRWGKPMVRSDLSGSPQLKFNASHAGEFALIAVAGGPDVGVDIERVRPVARIDALARRVLGDQASATLARTAEPARATCFFELWTAREAEAKARGGGLLVAPEQADRPPAAGERWTARPFRPAPGYVGTVVAEGTSWRLRCWEWSGAAEGTERG